MNDLPDWAKDRAREWLRAYLPDVHERSHVGYSLVALLVEVDENACHQTIVEMSEINEGEWARCKRETLAEARRIRAKREKGEARTTCRHGVQWPDFCQFNCAIGKPAQREKEK